MKREGELPTKHGRLITHIAGGCAIAGAALGAVMGQSWQIALLGALALTGFVGLLWAAGMLWSRGLDRGARHLEARHFKANPKEPASSSQDVV